MRKPVIRVPVIPDTNNVIATIQIQNFIKNEFIKAPAFVINGDDFPSLLFKTDVAAPIVTWSGATISAKVVVCLSNFFSWII